MGTMLVSPPWSACLAEQHSIIATGALSADVGVADAVGASADGGVRQEAAVVVGVGAGLCGEVDLLDDLRQA